MRIRSLFTLLCLMGSLPAGAQESIPLDVATANRLGLVFMPVTPADAAAGARFPARVIASPQDFSELHALHGGVLESWRVQPGEEVESGAVLAVIRSGEILGLQQEWVSAKEASQQAAVLLARDERLFAEGIIAEQRVQEAARADREARFRLQGAQAALAQAGFGTAELAALQAGGDDLGRYFIRAPGPGSVAHLNFRSGEVIEPGAAVVALTGGSLWVSAELPAALAARTQAGQELHVAEGGGSLVLRQKDQALDERSQTVGILAEFTGETNLMPGQLVTLLLPAQTTGIVVPAEAVVHNGMDTVVFVKNTGGVESRTLELQALGGDYLATEGLAPGEEVVVRGASLLKGIQLGLGGE